MCIILVPLFVLVNIPNFDFIELLKGFIRWGVFEYEFAHIDLGGNVFYLFIEISDFLVVFLQHLGFLVLFKFVCVFELLEQFNELCLDIVEHDDIVIFERVCVEPTQ